MGIENFYYYRTELCATFMGVLEFGCTWNFLIKFFLQLLIAGYTLRRMQIMSIVSQAAARVQRYVNIAFLFDANIYCAGNRSSGA